MLRLKIFFIKIALKLSYLCKKMQNFRALPPCLRRLGALPPDPQPPAAAEPHCPPAVGAPPPDPQISPPIANFWLRARIKQQDFACGI